MQHMIVLG